MGSLQGTERPHLLLGALISDFSLRDPEQYVLLFVSPWASGIEKAARMD